MSTSSGLPNNVGYASGSSAHMTFFGQENREDYERELKRRQEEHLQSILDNTPFRPCLHDSCPDCVGTGIKKDGRICVHGLSCPCPKCTPTC